MDSEPIDGILVWSLSDTGAYTLEQCDWYSADSFQLHCSVARFIRDQLDLFYSLFSEWFNLAEFPDATEQLEGDEIDLFLRAAGAPDGSDVHDVENYDRFAGLRAVIFARLEKGAPEQMKMSAELFNWTIDCALFLREENARAEIRLGTTAEVAPFVLKRILDRVHAEAKWQHGAPELLQDGFVRRFLPLVPMLNMLIEAFEADEKIDRGVGLRILHWVINRYKAELDS